MQERRGEYGRREGYCSTTRAHNNIHEGVGDREGAGLIHFPPLAAGAVDMNILMRAAVFGLIREEAAAACCCCCCCINSAEISGSCNETTIKSVVDARTILY